MEIITAEWLFSQAGLTASGSLAWKQPIPEKGPGVYVITIADASEEHQSIVYIGRSKHLSVRLRQFYRHKVGQRSPHKGGEGILSLASPKTVYWASVTNYPKAEHLMLEAFRNAVGALPYGNRKKAGLNANF